MPLDRANPGTDAASAASVEAFVGLAQQMPRARQQHAIYCLPTRPRQHVTQTVGRIEMHLNKVPEGSRRHQPSSSRHIGAVNANMNQGFVDVNDLVAMRDTTPHIPVLASVELFVEPAELFHDLGSHKQAV